MTIVQTGSFRRRCAGRSISRRPRRDWASSTICSIGILNLSGEACRRTSKADRAPGKAAGDCDRSQASRRGRGAVATVLVQQWNPDRRATWSSPARNFYGKVRAHGRRSRAARIAEGGTFDCRSRCVGLNGGVPDAGDRIEVAKDRERRPRHREITDYREQPDSARRSPIARVGTVRG